MKEKVYWTMKNGQKIDIDEMDINHLRNTLKMIVRNIFKSEERLYYIKDEEDDCYYEVLNDIYRYGVG